MNAKYALYIKVYNDMSYKKLYTSKFISIFVPVAETITHNNDRTFLFRVDSEPSLQIINDIFLPTNLIGKIGNIHQNCNKAFLNTFTYCFTRYRCNSKHFFLKNGKQFFIIYNVAVDGFCVQSNSTL